MAIKLYEDDYSDAEPNFYDPGFHPKVQQQTYNSHIFDSPMNINMFLDNYIYSHQEYKKALSLFIWKHVHGHSLGALLIAGASGTGKTEMIRVLSKIYPNIHVADGASIVPTGYKGNSSLATHLSSLDFTDTEFPPVLVIDEFDKLVSKGETWRDTSLISELLKFIEGGSFNIGNTDNPKYLDTTGLAVLLLGSFSALTESAPTHRIGFQADILYDRSSNNRLCRELIMDQLSPELKGRISQIVILDDFSEDDYFSILTDERYSPIKRLSKEYNLNLSLSVEKYHEIAHNAFISQTGVRSMNSAVSAYLDEHLFSDPNVREISIE